MKILQSNLTKLIAVVALALLFGGCTVTNKYGPYKGKVVDSATGKPIEGAVVFMRFFTYYLQPGGKSTWYADALEVLTDEKGEFKIPAYRINKFRVLNFWEKGPSVIVFKPGYGAFNGHKDASLSKWVDHFFPEDEYVTVSLPKLRTKEERIQNFGNIAFSSDVPREKWQNLYKFRDIENVAVGLTPFNDSYNQGK